MLGLKTVEMQLARVQRKEPIYRISEIAEIETYLPSLRRRNLSDNRNLYNSRPAILIPFGLIALVRALDHIK